jgi:hypothetical protein
MDQVIVGYRFQTPHIPGREIRRVLGTMFIDSLDDAFGHELANEARDLNPGETLLLDLQILGTSKMRAEE